MVRPAWSLLVAIGVVAACGGGGTENNGGNGSIDITPGTGMTLFVGTSGVLGYEVQDANGNGDPTAVATWSTGNTTIATISSDGIVTGHVVGVTQAIARSGSLADTVPIVVVDAMNLEVLPADTTIPIFGSVAYTVIATSAQGDTLPPPVVVWTSSDSGVAGINEAGGADGRTVGSTDIVASAGTIQSPPALLQVTGSAGTCYGITAATRFSGSVQWGYKAVNSQTDGGFYITADDNGNVHADLTRQGNGPFVFLWTGDLAAGSSAGVTQKKTDGGTGISTYTSTSGVMQPQPGAGLPKLSLIVDAQSCTYRVVTGASVATLLTDWFGNQVNSVDIVAYIQFGGPVPSDWQTNGIVRANDIMAANSVAYAGLNPTEDVLAPLGFVPELFSGPAPGDVGQASGGFTLTYAP